VFAILLNKEMDAFYQNISSFPTAIFTFVLAICVLYWLCAVLGVVDIDILDLNDAAGEVGLGNDAITPNAMSGVMLKFGLNGVPVTIIISFLSLFGWLFSYYSVHYLSPFIPKGILSYLFGVVILFITFFLAVLSTALILNIIRPFFQKIEQQTIRRVTGQRAMVRSSKVTDSSGEVFLNDGGAGLILKARSDEGKTFVKGDSVILLEYVEDKNFYRVISEKEFFH
jgi:hypothetical protein